MSYFQKLYENGELPHRAKLVYLYLHDRMDQERKAWPGIKTIAADLSLSRSTVKRAIRDLEKANLIRKEPHYRENGSATSNRYYILWNWNSMPRGWYAQTVDPAPVHREPPWKAYSKEITAEKDEYYRTVEGNSGDSCRQNQYSVGYYEILGYGVSAY